MSLVTDMLKNDAPGMKDAFGETVTFTPSGVAGVPVVAIINRNADHGGGVNARQWSVEIMIDDLPEKPGQNDKITINSEEFSVNETSGTKVDSDGVWWKIPVVAGEKSDYRGRRKI